MISSLFNSSEVYQEEIQRKEKNEFDAENISYKKPFLSLEDWYARTMEITEKTEDGVPVMAINGDIDLESSPQLREALKPKIAAKVPKLLLDFAAVNYIDSSGLATLIEYFQGAQAHGGKLGLASLSPRVKNVFEIVRLQEVFSIYPDMASAVAALKA